MLKRNTLKNNTKSVSRENEVDPADNVAAANETVKELREETNSARRKADEKRSKDAEPASLRLMELSITQLLKMIETNSNEFKQYREDMENYKIATTEAIRVLSEEVNSLRTTLEQALEEAEDGDEAEDEARDVEAEDGDEEDGDEEDGEPRNVEAEEDGDEEDGDEEDGEPRNVEAEEDGDEEDGATPVWDKVHEAFLRLKLGQQQQILIKVRDGMGWDKSVKCSIKRISGDEDAIFEMAQAMLDLDFATIDDLC